MWMDQTPSVWLIQQRCSSSFAVNSIPGFYPYASGVRHSSSHRCKRADVRKGSSSELFQLEGRLWECGWCEPRSGFQSKSGWSSFQGLPRHGMTSGPISRFFTEGTGTARFLLQHPYYAIGWRSVKELLTVRTDIEIGIYINIVEWRCFMVVLGPFHGDQHLRDLRKSTGSCFKPMAIHSSSKKLTSSLPACDFCHFSYFRGFHRASPKR
jgi:hypothetical protein